MESTTDIFEVIHKVPIKLRQKAVEQMRLALMDSNNVYLYYVGGILYIDLEKDLTVTVNISEHEKMTKEERQLAAQLYLKNKTESHSYYKLAQELAEMPEEKNDMTDHVRALRSALERMIPALRNRNLGKPYACLDEVFEEARIALEKTENFGL